MQPVISQLKVAAWIFASVLAGCGENIYNEIELMPAPTVYQTGALDPFRSKSVDELQQHSTLFYATDRSPATTQDKQAFYANTRGIALRVGTAQVHMDPPADNWDDLRDITFDGERETPRALSVVSATEIGPLPFSSSDATGAKVPAEEKREASTAFVRAINAQLSRSGNRDVFIYVHGYNVDFEYPTLVAKELQHFLATKAHSSAITGPQHPADWPI
ncbi:MAG: hypothetical protein ACU0BB_07110 [Paracoccaceae bacterium]